MKIATLSACLLASLVAAPALSQDTGAAPPSAQTAPAEAAPPARWAGLPVAEISARITAVGTTVGEPQVNGDRTYLIVQDGPIRWIATLFSCTEGACPDIQFTAVFEGAQATEAVVSRWNAERRFVKAFYAAPETEGGPGRAVAQYDVLLSLGAGPNQLDDPIQVWRSLAVDLGRTVNPQPTP